MQIFIKKSRTSYLEKICLGALLVSFSFTGGSYAAPAANALGRSYTVRLAYKNVPVKEVTEAITKQTGVVFSYESNLGNRRIPQVSINSADQPLENVLEHVFRNTGITYRVTEQVVALSITQPVNPAKKESKITGTVVDEHGEPLIGVNILVKGATIGTVTDADGHFTITAPANGILRFVYLGYKTQELRVPSRGALKVIMSEDTKTLDEVVVVGYGTQARRTLTSSISKVDGSKMESIPVNSVGEGLKGKVAGLRVATVDSQPGANPKFLIRGGSSINQSNDPIIMVDGVQRDMTGLNPNDIESIEVLKDAASAGIYGARASNGVVLITTKKGSASRGPQVTFEAQLAYQQPVTKFDLMSAGDYISFLRPAIAESYNPSVLYAAESAGTGNDENSKWTTRYLNEGETIPAGWKSIVDPINPEKTIIFQDNDQQAQWFDNTLWQNYYVGVNGGNDKIKYATSAGYTNDGGLGIGTGFSRFTVHGNTSYHVTKRLQVSSTFDFAQTDTKDFPSNKRNTVIRGLSIPNTHRDYLEDGTPALGTNNTTISAAFYNRYYERNNVQKRASVNVNLSWEILDGLKAVAQLSEHNRHTRSNSFLKANAISSTRAMAEGFSETNRLDFQTFLNYRKSFAQKHNIDVLGGYDYMYDKVNSFDAQVTGAVSDKVPILDAGTMVVAGYPKSTRTKECLISFFGRANYNYDEKYLLSFTMRADASSKFSKDNRWGYFPAGSAGWVVSQEPFWEDLSDKMSTLKLRASYGLTGNNGIGLYDTYGSYLTTNIYNGNATTTMGIMPNTGLTWETTSQFDLGVDMGFLNERIRVNADYYNKVTRDLLFDVTLPNTTGYSTATANIGKVRFYGAEFEISSVNIKNRNFSWNTDFTYSYNMNKVLELPSNGLDKNRINGHVVGDGTQFGGIAEGERLGRLYGYKVAYILETQAQADAAMYDELSRGYRRSDRLNSSSNPSLQGRKDIGDYEWVNRPGSTKDSNGNDIITAEDQFLMGYVTPHSTGGLNNTFNYKNFSLSIYLDYALGHTVYNNLQMRYFEATMGNCNYNLVNDVRKTWREPGDKTKYARFTANDPDWGNRNYGRISNVFCQKGDYLCLRDVTLSYNLPKQWISKLSMNNVTLSVTGNTLFYWTAVTGISPEAVTSSGPGLYSVKSNYDTDYNPYPPARKIMFTAKVVF